MSDDEDGKTIEKALSLQERAIDVAVSYLLRHGELNELMEISRKATHSMQSVIRLRGRRREGDPDA
jgi:predicted RNase H-like HicB family nuclease